MMILLALVATCHAVALRPVVGVLTQPSEEGWPNPTSSYIAASYVKYLEGAGARVVPVFFSRDTVYLESMFARINGVLFPGGGQTLDDSQLLAATTFFVKRALQAHAAGDYFPVFGHCQGFESTLMAITGLPLEQCMVHVPQYRAENVSLPIAVVAGSRWFADMPPSVLATLTGTRSTLNNHEWSVPTGLWHNLSASTPLRDYRVVSTTVSPAGSPFVSNYEHKEAPIYAMQFHAEKPIYEWPNENINHSRPNVRAMQWFANFAVDEASKSQHVFPSESELDTQLIYNYCPQFSIGYSSFDQLYFFHEESISSQ